MEHQIDHAILLLHERQYV